ncbi:uncharacterized protein LOC110348719 [Heterocephalus glaber]|uniref:Uncharacterized protein LOC110348719 n=1 Tax=Heterocephalus glaber TaxID=10181 RepID=A0AAX6SUM8_HETGA|nr:uncharacterized protein LOC110348719 [Heterocephalus glaber]
MGHSEDFGLQPKSQEEADPRLKRGASWPTGFSKTPEPVEEAQGQLASTDTPQGRWCGCSIYTAGLGDAKELGDLRITGPSGRDQGLPAVAQICGQGAAQHPPVPHGSCKENLLPTDAPLGRSRTPQCSAPNAADVLDSPAQLLSLEKPQSRESSLSTAPQTSLPGTAHTGCTAQVSEDVSSHPWPGPGWAARREDGALVTPGVRWARDRIKPRAGARARDSTVLPRWLRLTPCWAVRSWGPRLPASGPQRPAPGGVDGGKCREQVGAGEARMVSVPGVPWGQQDWGG